MKEADIAAREMGDSKIRGVHVNRSITVNDLQTELMVEDAAEVQGVIDGTRDGSLYKGELDKTYWCVGSVVDERENQTQGSKRYQIQSISLQYSAQLTRHQILSDSQETRLN
jgi:hypothetical protein